MKTTESEEARDDATPPFQSIAEDKLTGAEQIRDFIDPSMPLRTVRRLLEDGHIPSWRTGHEYWGSKSAIREHWQRMTRSFSSAEARKRARQRDAGVAEGAP